MYSIQIYAATKVLSHVEMHPIQPYVTARIAPHTEMYSNQLCHKKSVTTKVPSIARCTP
jgi:hypothetical protein